LNTEEFASVREAKALAQAWKEDYNRSRPHSALGYRTPAEYAAACVRLPVQQTGADTHRQATAAWGAPRLGSFALPHPTPWEEETLITTGT